MGARSSSSPSPVPPVPEAPAALAALAGKDGKDGERGGLKRFTLGELAAYSGIGAPMYVGVLGRVHDVSASENFEHGQGYGKVWAGRDATYALAMSSLRDEDANRLDWDAKDFNTAQLRALQMWQLYFAQKYPQVGVLAEYEGRCLELPADVVGDVVLPALDSSWAPPMASASAPPPRSETAAPRGFALRVEYESYTPPKFGRDLRAAADDAGVVVSLISSDGWAPGLSITDAQGKTVTLDDMNSGDLGDEGHRFPLSVVYTLQLS